VTVSPVTAGKGRRARMNILDRIGRKSSIDVCFTLRGARLTKRICKQRG
jgi:hypothetical protein